MQHHRKAMIGGIAVTPICDGSLESSLDKVVDADRSIAAALIGQVGGNPLRLPVLAFLLNIEGRLALVDAGAGGTMGPSMGRLLESLTAIGVSPDAIGHVLITHLHRDHFGGLLDDAGRPTFASAELILHEDEAKFWLGTEARDMPERARRFLDLTLRSIAPYRDRIRTVGNGGGLPGVAAVLQPGHTPGHTCWLIESEGRSALLVGDLMHVSAVHLPRPDVRMVYDLDPARAVESRRRVLDWVASERIPIAGAHLAAPGLCRVVRHANGYRFDVDG